MPANGKSTRLLFHLSVDYFKHSIQPFVVVERWVAYLQHSKDSTLRKTENIILSLSDSLSEFRNIPLQLPAYYFGFEQSVSEPFVVLWKKYLVFVNILYIICMLSTWHIQSIVHIFLAQSFASSGV